MMKDWKRTLITRAAEWGLPDSGQWNVLFHNNYHQNISTINLLWFHRNDPFPRVITKMKRDRELLTREFRNLENLYQVAPRHVPRPIHLGETTGFGMLWMEGVPGHCIPPGGGRLATSLGPAVDMLASIHHALNKDPAPVIADRHARTVAAPIAAVLGREPSRAVRDGCIALQAAATPAWLASLPAIPQHGDLYLDNVLQYRAERHIIDWEDFGTVDLPFYDLVTLLLSSLRASASEPAQWDTRITKQVPQLIDRYAQAVATPVTALKTLLPLVLVNRFYYHWAEGRAALSISSTDLEHYFDHSAHWQQVFGGD